MPRASTGPGAVVAKIVESGKDTHGKIVGGKKPSMKFPLRSLSNVRYAPKQGHFEMVGKKKERTLTVSTVKTFAQTLRMVALSERLIEADDRDMKRDAYYKLRAKAFELLLKLGARAEQQAFAKFDLNYVMDECLPAKLKHPEKSLP